MILVPFLTALLFFTAFAFLGISNPFKNFFNTNVRYYTLSGALLSLFRASVIPPEIGGDTDAWLR
jgi:hypothetical protein